MKRLAIRIGIIFVALSSGISGCNRVCKEHIKNYPVIPPAILGYTPYGFGNRSIKVTKLWTYIDLPENLDKGDKLNGFIDADVFLDCKMEVKQVELNSVFLKKYGHSNSFLFYFSDCRIPLFRKNFTAKLEEYIYSDLSSRDSLSTYLSIQRALSCDTLYPVFIKMRVETDSTRAAMIRSRKRLDEHFSE